LMFLRDSAGFSRLSSSIDLSETPITSFVMSSYFYRCALRQFSSNFR
jgi:hypothetical protein